MALGPSIPESDILPQPSKPEEIALHNAIRDFIQRTNDNLQFFIQAPVTSVTTTYTATPGDYTILADATGGTFTVNLPAASPNKGRVFIVKKINATNTVTIDADGAELIEASTTYALTTQWSSATLHSDGTGWYVINNKS